MTTTKRDFSHTFDYAIAIWESYGKREGIAAIAAFLRSRHRLSPADREWLASYVEGSIRLPRGRPPLNYPMRIWFTDVHVAASEVRSLVSRRVADGEKRRGLKAKVIAEVVPRFCPDDMEFSDFEQKLVTLLARSSQPRRR